MIDPDAGGPQISKDIYGQFSEHLGHCIYGGLYVGKESDIPNCNGMRTDVVNALKEIRVPLLRWPGGCFADEYHWRDGIGPAADRKKIVNTNWGGVTEDNSFGTHEFMELCRQLGCDAYINGNLGSGSVREMSEWVEYLTFGGDSPLSRLRAENGHPEPWNIRYFAVGNESWGGGGCMRPSYYADLYRQYQTFLRIYDPAHPFQKLAVGANGSDYGWTREVLTACFDHSPRQAHGYMDLLSLHYYTVPGTWAHKGSATEFSEQEYYTTLEKTWQMKELIDRHSQIMDTFDPEKKIGLAVDEWGTWYDVEPGTNPGFLYQQNTMRDAIVAAVNLNLFNTHCDRVRMANLAQLCNVLQSPILTQGAQMVRTPTYYVFDLFKEHQNARLAKSTLTCPTCFLSSGAQIPQLSASASLDSSRILHVTLANGSADRAEEVQTVLSRGKVLRADGTVLTGQTADCNTFERPDRILPHELRVLCGPEGLRFTLPPCSVSRISIQLAAE
jgi:alpha-N-arabinofuranosidase